MNNRLAFVALAASVTAVAGCATSNQMTGQQKTQQIEKQSALASSAADTLNRQHQRPNENRIPRVLVRNARCVGVFPSVTQAGLIVGGSHGSGLVSCRGKDGNFGGSPPAAFDLTSGSLGLQAGGHTGSIIVLFQTKPAVDGLLDGQIGLGTQMGATSGPSGWERAAGKAANSPVVIYNQSKRGLYAGLTVQGGKLTFNQKANAALYEPGVTAHDILLSQRSAPGAVASFNAALHRWGDPAPNNNSQNANGNANENSNGKSNENSGSNSGQNPNQGSEQSSNQNSGQNPDQNSGPDSNSNPNQNPGSNSNPNPNSGQNDN